MKKVILTIATLCLVLAANVSVAKEAKQEMVLSKDNTLVLNDVVDDMNVARVIAEARKMDASLKSGYPIVLFMNTPGGSIQAGIELIEALKSLNRPVITLTMFSASMGFQIVQHLGQRNILDYGVLMSHKAFGGFKGEFGGEGLSQIDSRYGFWLRRLKMMDEQTVKRSGGKQTLKSYRTAYENELWLNGPEAVEEGYADKMVTARCDTSLSGTRTVEIPFFGMTFQIKFSDCPLITAPLEITILVHTNVGAIALNEFLQKGGLMGVDCPPSEYNGYYYSQQNVPVGPPAPTRQIVCSLDKTLTVEKINEEKEKVYQKYILGNKKKDIKVTF